MLQPVSSRSAGRAVGAGRGAGVEDDSRPAVHAGVRPGAPGEAAVMPPATVIISRGPSGDRPDPTAIERRTAQWSGSLPLGALCGDQPPVT